VHVRYTDNLDDAQKTRARLNTPLPEFARAIAAQLRARGSRPCPRRAAPRGRRGRVTEARGAEGRGNTTVLLCTDRSAVRDKLAAAGLPVAAPPLLPRSGAGGYTQVGPAPPRSEPPPRRERRA